jgi:hypothetical protein
VALALDASSPAAVVGATATTTTASFSPPANSLLVAWVMADAGTGATGEQCTVTSTGGLSWSLARRHNGSPGADVEVWSAQAVSAPGSITVSLTDNQGSVDKRLFVRVFTDAGNGTPAGIGASNSSAATSVAYTSTVANSWGWSVGLGGGGTPVAGASQTLQDSDTAFDGGDGCFVVDQNATTSSAGTSVTMSVTAPSTVLHHVAVEVLPASTATIPPPNTRTVPGRDYGEVQWAQKDRRNANLVATAANPLSSPLDTAWQAGARYWHLYGDSADAAPRTWQSLQRNLVSDPALLGPVATDPLTVAAGVGGDTWRRYNTPEYADRREVPQQRSYVSNPALLSSALLENELLGGADTARHYVTSVYVDRREVPQQRRYVSDPGLLATAELENELLGGADTARRYRQPATHLDRRETVAPRVYFADVDQVSIVGTGATAAWWGHDDTGAYLANTRRTFDLSGLQPPTVYDPTLSGLLPVWQEYNQAAVHADRREVPQQRLYISDPSTYPQFPPTNPLTLAWGVGGTYWLLYNTAALQVGRREVPAAARVRLGSGAAVHLAAGERAARRRRHGPALPRRGVRRPARGPCPARLRLGPAAAGDGAAGERAARLGRRPAAALPGRGLRRPPGGPGPAAPAGSVAARRRADRPAAPGRGRGRGHVAPGEHTGVRGPAGGSRAAAGPHVLRRRRSGFPAADPGLGRGRRAVAPVQPGGVPHGQLAGLDAAAGLHVRLHDPPPGHRHGRPWRDRHDQPPVHRDRRGSLLLREVECRLPR